MLASLLLLRTIPGRASILPPPSFSIFDKWASHVCRIFKLGCAAFAAVIFAPPDPDHFQPAPQWVPVCCVHILPLVRDPEFEPEAYYLKRENKLPSNSVI